MLSQVGGALAYAHRQGVVHRNIEPANVLLDEDGNAYLSDFGIAADVPPEKTGELALRSDIYELGVLAFELLTGRRPPLDGAVPSVRPVPSTNPETLQKTLVREVNACMPSRHAGSGALPSMRRLAT